MKKLSDKEIRALFKKILPNGADFFQYFQEFRQLKLDGIFTSDQLHQLASLMDSLIFKENEVKRIGRVKVGKFTAKDIKVLWFWTWIDDNSSDIRYQFFIMKGGKDWDIYYGLCGQEYASPKWWPHVEDGDYLLPVYEFIPDGFGEDSENCYTYDGTHEEALELLKECGFTIDELKKV
jgi:hypothetical protein